jgi:quercetin dioxygenase-like cupin family protein
MPRAGDVLDLSSIGAIVHVKKTSKETQGRSFEMEWELFPNTGGTPVHIHPHATESYEVLAGELDLYVDGSWTRVSAGGKASVAPGVPHTFRNASDAPTRVYNTHAPAMRYGEYFEGLHRVVRSCAVPAGRLTLKAMLYLSVLMTTYEEEIRCIKPPHALMRILALVARSLRYRLPPPGANYTPS